MTDAGMSIADANAILAEVESVQGTAPAKSFDQDPLETERFASASDYSKGETITPAKAQLQTIIQREKQRVTGEFRPGTLKHTSSRKQIGSYIMTSERASPRLVHTHDSFSKRFRRSYHSALIYVLISHKWVACGRLEARGVIRLLLD
ncbi:hypothetical protein WJX77_005632 [Trebouxia sp. C0004]